MILKQMYDKQKTYEVHFGEYRNIPSKATLTRNKPAAQAAGQTLPH